MVVNINLKEDTNIVVGTDQQRSPSLLLLFSEVGASRLRYRCFRKDPYGSQTQTYKGGVLRSDQPGSHF